MPTSFSHATGNCRSTTLQDATNKMEIVTVLHKQRRVTIITISSTLLAEDNIMLKCNFFLNLSMYFTDIVRAFMIVYQLLTLVNQ